ncbi:MAG: hypothetical protein LIO86_09280 [Lachnospiraceae bacterium]|nr:hypothetical protein [Lachnospiraceae bacterium]
MKKIDLSTPAKVKYIGSEGNSKFTANQIYDAYFIEYWVGERKSLHVKGNDGKITDFNELADFVVLEDKGNVLNFYEAKVKCITDKFQNVVCGVTKGKEYPVAACQSYTHDSRNCQYCYESFFHLNFPPVFRFYARILTFYVSHKQDTGTERKFVCPRQIRSKNCQFNILSIVFTNSVSEDQRSLRAS